MEERITSDTVVDVPLALSQILNLAEFMEMQLIYYIREDDEVDNMYWLLSMCDAYRTLMSTYEEYQKKCPDGVMPEPCFGKYQFTPTGYYPDIEE